MANHTPIDAQTVDRSHPTVVTEPVIDQGRVPNRRGIKVVGLFRVEIDKAAVYARTIGIGRVGRASRIYELVAWPRLATCTSTARIGSF